MRTTKARKVSETPETLDYVSTGEAAAMLCCTTGWIRNRLISGQLKGQKLNGRAWLVSRASVRWYEKHRRPVGRPLGK